MPFLPPLPIPAEAWLRAANERNRGHDMASEERPVRAMEEWAALHGQPPSFGSLAPSHLGGPAWAAIDGFFRTHTKLGHERTQPLGRAAWLYDSFYPINLIILLGGNEPIGEIDPLSCLDETMPNSLLHDFSRDEPRIQEYLDHLANAFDSFANSDRIIQNLSEPAARDFLGDAATQLDSAVSGLLNTPPNSHAAGHARLAFETSLKALLAEKAGLTKEEAADRKISHHLDKIFERSGDCCSEFIPVADFDRIKNAALDAISPREMFPRHGAHYDAVTLPNRQLWDCYAAAQYAFATVLRVFGAPDSRACQPRQKQC
ncbi:MAG: hypothetical protein ACR2NX_10345 [Chthoniobacterales bacterium]